MARIVVCGLGPATPDLVTAATLAAIERVPARFVRTRRHPSSEVVGPDAEDFDQLYESAASFDEVYDGIVEAVVAAATAQGEVLYAVPGSPTVAESTVERLRADKRVDVEVLPAVSFLDLAWDRLGIDPIDDSVRLVDAYSFGTEAAGERGPLLVAQCDNRQVLSDMKLLISEALGVTDDAETATVTVLQRLGLPDELVTEVPWEDLDRAFEPDHLTSVYIPQLAAPVAGEMARLAEICRRLRAECPWDREQTHASLRRYLLEEAYEVLEALDHLDVEAGEGFAALEEELGDLVFQVVFHSTLAAEEGQFDLTDVLRGIGDKLVSRHPHVFGDVEVENADEVAARWEEIKKAEKGRTDAFDGIPVALPALAYAAKVMKRIEQAGVDWRELADGMDDLYGWQSELLEVVDELRERDADTESLLRGTVDQLRDAFRRA
jgi:tetrapyrrole methylase family protein / MazG family protein